MIYHPQSIKTGSIWLLVETQYQRLTRNAHQNAILYQGPATKWLGGKSAHANLVHKHSVRGYISWFPICMIIHVSWERASANKHNAQKMSPITSKEKPQCLRQPWGWLHQSTKKRDQCLCDSGANTLTFKQYIEKRRETSRLWPVGCIHLKYSHQKYYIYRIYQYLVISYLLPR